MIQERYSSNKEHFVTNWASKTDRNLSFFRNKMKVPLPPRIPSVILEEFEEDTIQELADTMEPGVVFSTEDHTYVFI